MEPKQPASHEQSGLENPKPDTLEEGVNTEVPEPNVKDHKPVKPETSYVMRKLLRSLCRVLAHPLSVVIVGGAIVGLLTHLYTLQQKSIDYDRSIQLQKLTSQRSFLDELNKIRIQKIGETWEQLDKDEVTIDNLLEQAKKSSNPNDDKTHNVNAINLSSLIREDRLIINKNRFWLGEEKYNEIKEHFDKSDQLALNILLARPGTDLSEIIAMREQTKKDILQVRKSMLIEDEPCK